LQMAALRSAGGKWRLWPAPEMIAAHGGPVVVL
jgi:hypothetical protein